MRIYSLDYLRGLAAVGIMVYHYLSWTLGKYQADTIMGRIGIYGVLSDGNQIDPRVNYKISFALLDDRNMKWNF